MTEKTLIIEDGTCVPDANSWHTVQDVRDYFSRLPNGSHWSMTDAGCMIDDDVAEKSIAAAVEYMKLLDWKNNCCCENDLPMPYDCGCSNGCSKGSHDALVKASILLTDAFAQGWSPYYTKTQDIMVKSMSTPGGGSYSFSEPVDLESFRGAAKGARSRPISGPPSYSGLMFKLDRILGCFLKSSSDGDIKLIM